MLGDSEFSAAYTQVAADFVTARSASTGRTTTLSNQAAPGTLTSSWTSKQTLYTYDNALQQFRAAVAANISAPRAVLIYLGTNDANSGNDPSGWTANMNTIIGNLRIDLQMPALQCVFCILPVGVGSGKDATNWAAVRSQQIAYSGTNNAIGVQMPEGGYTDGLHFDAAASVVVANSLASAL